MGGLGADSVVCDFSISGWKEDTISEYIVSKVKQTDPEVEAASSSEDSDAKEDKEVTEASVDTKDEL